jgi:hypothetical protein
MRVVGSGAKRTKIMYYANLSYLLLNKYLQDALRARLLRFAADEYVVTRKGEAFLERYMGFRESYYQVKADMDKLKSEAKILEKMCGRGPRKRSRRTSFATLG